MGIANFPANLAAAIQQNYLKRRWEKSLQAELGYRAVATRELFVNGIGQTLTSTKPGLLAPVTTPLDPTTITNLDDGLTPTNWSVEQYQLAINEYASTQDLNIVANVVGIASQFLKNAEILGEQARKSLDVLVLRKVLNSYMGGNSRVTVTLGSANATINVDDIRGFQTVFPAPSGGSSALQIPVNSSNTMPVQVGSNIYTLITATPDVSNVSTVASLGGISGTLTFNSTVSTGDGTAGNAVVSAYAPLILRPNSRTTTLAIQATDYLTLDLLRQAVTNLQNNNIPTYEDGNYLAVISPDSFAQLYRDPEFQILFRGTEFKSQAYRNFWQSTALGLNLVKTNMAPQQILGSRQIQRPIIFGQEAVIEADAEAAREVLNSKYGDELHDIEEMDGIFHITRAPLDRIKHIIAQSWFYIGGFTTPTDSLATPATLPTATNAYFKRAVMIETAT